MSSNSVSPVKDNDSLSNMIEMELSNRQDKDTVETQVNEYAESLTDVESLSNRSSRATTLVNVRNGTPSAVTTRRNSTETQREDTTSDTTVVAPEEPEEPPLTPEERRQRRRSFLTVFAVYILLWYIPLVFPTLGGIAYIWIEYGDHYDATKRVYQVARALQAILPVLLTFAVFTTLYLAYLAERSPRMRARPYLHRSLQITAIIHAAFFVIVALISLIICWTKYHAREFRDPSCDPYHNNECYTRRQNLKAFGIASSILFPFSLWLLDRSLSFFSGKIVGYVRAAYLLFLLSLIPLGIVAGFIRVTVLRYGDPDFDAHSRKYKYKIDVAFTALTTVMAFLFMWLAFYVLGIVFCVIPYLIIKSLRYLVWDLPKKMCMGLFGKASEPTQESQGEIQGVSLPELPDMSQDGEQRLARTGGTLASSSATKAHRERPPAFLAIARGGACG